MESQTARKSVPEPLTGYEGSEGKGKFECSNCKYYDSDSSSCCQEDMVKHSKLPRVAGNDRVIVDPEGCCWHVERLAKDDYEEKSD